MKKLLFIILFFYSVYSFAQTGKKIDSIYYLLDTAKTPRLERMWDVDIEYGDIKVYSMRCICLQYNQRPTFSYHPDIDKGRTLTKKDLETIKLVSLSDLLLKAKQFTTIGFKGRYAIFIVEPDGRRYVCHRVNLFIPREPSIDYENIPRPDSTKSNRH